MNLATDNINQTYQDYCKNYNQYFNPFEVLKIGENTISQLLAWLLDCNWVKEFDTKENQIHREFTFAFLKTIQKQEENSSLNAKVLINFSDKQIQELADNMQSIPDKDNIDIFLQSHYTDNNGNIKDFVCIVENKKKAKLSCPPASCQIQIERYYNEINEKYKDFTKKFVYLCADVSDTEVFTIPQRLVDKGEIPDYIKNDLTIKGKYRYSDIENRSIKWLLDEFGYTIIEHSEVILDLYNILKNKCSDRFYNGIIKPISIDKMFSMVEDLIPLYKPTSIETIENAKEIIARKEEIINLYNNRIKSDNDKFFRYDKDIKTTGIEIAGNAKISFYEKFSNFDYEKRMDYLLSYIEYWELHKSVGYLQDNIIGYGKIVNGEFFPIYK